MALIACIGPILVKPVLEWVCRWCGHNIFRKIVPLWLWYHSSTEEEFSDIQSGSFDRDLHTMSSQIALVLPGGER